MLPQEREGPAAWAEARGPLARRSRRISLPPRKAGRPRACGGKRPWRMISSACRTQPRGLPIRKAGRPRSPSCSRTAAAGRPWPATSRATRGSPSARRPTSWGRSCRSAARRTRPCRTHSTRRPAWFSTCRAPRVWLEILSVDGIDGAVIGRADLSTDLGLPGQTNHPEVVRRIEMMIEACQRHRKVPGLLVQDVVSAKEWIAKGIRLVPYANEVSLLVNAGARAVGEIRKFAKEGR